MLADSAESVVRSSRDRSPERIDALVDGVISERLSERQLDECDLTLRDLKIIGESFKTSLRAVYHPRIDYPPPTEEERAAQAARFLEQVPSAPIDGTSPPIEIERPA
jgi:membrane-associated HD superfamily phosphohydrolase